MDISIRIGGEAGQGIQSISSIIAKTFARHDFYVFINQDFASRIRGGHNFVAVSTAVREITSHYMKAELVVALDKRSFEVHRDHLADGGVLVYNSDEMSIADGIGIPMATLAGILIVVAYNMSEWRAFLRLFHGPRSDVLVLLTTFALTVAIDLTVAIQVGVVLAALLFMRRMAEVTQVRALREIVDYEASEAGDGPASPLPAGVEVFEINGSFCFGAARKFTETLLSLQSAPEVVILRMRHVLAMDATGLEALEEVAARFRRRGTALLLSGVHAQPLVVMERSGALDRLGELPLFLGQRLHARAHAVHRQLGLA